jgi:hypothetical protein
MAEVQSSFFLLGSGQQKLTLLFFLKKKKIFTFCNKQLGRQERRWNERLQRIKRKELKVVEWTEVAWNMVQVSAVLKSLTNTDVPKHARNLTKLATTSFSRMS